MNIDDVRRRARDLKAEVKAKNAQMKAGEISVKQYNDFINAAYDESQQLEALRENFEKAGVVMGRQRPLSASRSRPSVSGSSVCRRQWI